MDTIICAICAESANLACRSCQKPICGKCLHQWRAQCYNMKKNPNCPYCRGVWDRPNFYIETPGTYEDTHITIYCNGHTYQVLPVHTDKVVGFAVLDPELYDGPMSLHLDDLRQLEPYAANLKWLFQDLENYRAVFSSTMPHEHILSQFQKAEVDLETLLQTDEHIVYGSKHLDQIFKASQTLRIGFF